MILYFFCPKFTLVGFSGDGLLRIWLSFLFFLITTISFAYVPDVLPPMEDPMLMTVWGESQELNTVNYFCGTLFIARDYSPGATLEQMKMGAGFGKAKESEGDIFYHFYTAGTRYRTLIVIAGGGSEKHLEDIARVEEMATEIKKENGLVMIIDIDVDDSGDDSIKAEFARRLIPLTDAVVFAGSSSENYASALYEDSPIVLKLSIVVDLLIVFERDFGGGRCCD